MDSETKKAVKWGLILGSVALIVILIFWGG